MRLLHDEQCVDHADHLGEPVTEACICDWIEAARADESAKQQGVVVGVTGAIQDRGRILGREEVLLELRGKVTALDPAGVAWGTEGPDALLKRSEVLELIDGSFSDGRDG